MPKIGNWLCPLPNGGESEELLIRFDGDSDCHVLIIPPLFNQHNLLRRQLVTVMRCLHKAGVRSVLPDLPGWNESLQSLDEQTITHWKSAITKAAESLGATHFLAVRSGALLAPENLPGWLYAPQTGANLLRSMIRARQVANKEMGRAEPDTDLLEYGKTHGLNLAGWSLGAAMVSELEKANIAAPERRQTISPEALGGPSLWLRAEAGEDQDQAEALAQVIIGGLPHVGAPV